MTLSNSLAADAESLREWRRDFHRHPELGYEEHRTSRVVAERLREFGVDAIETGIAGTGVVATIHGADGPGQGEAEAILLRADMDALPMQEMNAFEHRSTSDGRMHACGHDGHTAMLLGAARHLAATRNFKGTIYVCFQPAEEGGAGAKAMIRDGLFERFPCRQVFGMHNWPGVPIGNFAVRTGPIMAIAGEFTVKIRGKGGHAAMPDLSRDPVVAGAALVGALQTIVSRRLPPVQPAVLSITQFHAGEAFNVIPDEAVLNGTIRSFDTEVHRMAYAALDEITNQVAAAYGVEAEVDHGMEPYPPTVNDAAATDLAARAAMDLVGAAQVDANAPPSMGGEDFAYMTQEKPGCYIMIGNGDSAPLHHAQYDFNDDVAPLGVAYWARLAEIALPR